MAAGSGKVCQRSSAAAKVDAANKNKMTANAFQKRVIFSPLRLGPRSASRLAGLVNKLSLRRMSDPGPRTRVNVPSESSPHWLTEHQTKNPPVQ
ncbi:hypothetical protein, partial [Mesorhizobium sp. M7A.T.Ca.TU.009.02.1.1]|uniref:hypothetical protein n=1 Tax=Mesorhizobium sp. M7A.T.Ca.TU.009.02.1.1 TaxID=2496791 RepID=UPI0019D28A00